MLEDDLHAGHRARLRQRFIKSPEGLQDYKLLEFLLFGILPRRDTKKVAKHLLKTFGNLQKIFNAELSELIKIEGISHNTAAFLQGIHYAHVRMAQEKIINQPIIQCWQNVLDYCRLAMGHMQREHLRILFLNTKNILIADELQQTGTIDQTAIYPREVIKRALDIGAASVILVHNHPSGDPTPSRQDIEITKLIKDAGEKLGIQLYDHLIVSAYDFRSLRTLGHI